MKNSKRKLVAAIFSLLAITIGQQAMASNSDYVRELSEMSVPQLVAEVGANHSKVALACGIGYPALASEVVTLVSASVGHYVVCFNCLKTQKLIGQFSESKIKNDSRGVHQACKEYLSDFIDSVSVLATTDKEIFEVYAKVIKRVGSKYSN